jgi:UDP-N-acetyl-D-mannosaminuronic acid dehydrogenase
VLPGHVLRELVDNDRIIGGMTEACAEKAIELYKLFVEGECIVTNARTAEMTKLTENSFRDVNIAFANELSLICDKLDINVWELIALSNRHPRVNILQPGPGVGGHCIAVDPWFIVSKTPDQARLIKTAREVNDSKPEYVLSKVMDAAAKTKDPRIAIFGLAFKANIDDLRESPAVQIALSVAKLNIGQILLVEPNISELPNEFRDMQNVILSNVENAVQAANIFVGLVDHNEFRSLMLDCDAENVIDTRGMWRTQ